MGSGPGTAIAIAATISTMELAAFFRWAVSRISKAQDRELEIIRSTVATEGQISELRALLSGLDTRISVRLDRHDALLERLFETTTERVNATSVELSAVRAHLEAHIAAAKRTGTEG